ncbi:MAG: hypothetical protein ACOYNP_14640, partial [Gemmataceae bacterium]
TALGGNGGNGAGLAIDRAGEIVSNTSGGLSTGVSWACALNAHVVTRMSFSHIWRIKSPTSLQR